MSRTKKFNIEIPEIQTEKFDWEINIPKCLSSIESHEKDVNMLGNRKDKYSKSELTFDTGILEDVPNYGFFKVNMKELVFGLELMESINEETLVSVKDCELEFYSEKKRIDRFSRSAEYLNPIVSKRQEVTGNPAEFRKFNCWFGQYDIPKYEPDRYQFCHYEDVDRILITWTVERATDGKVIEIETPHSSYKKVVTQVAVDNEWKVWNATASRFFGSKHLSDVIFVCDGTEFPSHRFVLSIKSPVFRRMFQSEMKEAKEGKIIVDFNPEIFKELLHFMYCGTVEKLGAVSKDLIIAADYYDIPLLKKICEKSLVGQLNKKNSVEMYCLAEPLRAKTLMEKALKIIKANRTTVFRNSKNASEFA